MFWGDKETELPFKNANFQKMFPGSDPIFKFLNVACQT